MKELNYVSIGNGSIHNQTINSLIVNGSWLPAHDSYHAAPGPVLLPPAALPLAWNCGPLLAMRHEP